MGSLRVRHNWVTSLSLFTFTSDCRPGEGDGNPLKCSCLENPMDGGAWWATVHGVAKSQTQLSDLTFTFHFYALKKEMATHSSVLAWRIPRTAEPGGLPSMGLHRFGHDWSDLAVAVSRMAIIDKINSISVDKDVKTLKPLQHSWWECNVVHLFWKQFDGFLKRCT